MTPEERQARRERFKQRREFRALLERSSLAEDKLWVRCGKHGRQARDPYTKECVECIVDVMHP